MNYKIINKEYDSFGSVCYTVQAEDGRVFHLSFDEGNWPDALQLSNMIRSELGELIGE